jgi:hypothetical protein
MDSRHDHGEGAGASAEQGSNTSTAAAAEQHRATVSIHPVLKALVQLLAREAAAECLLVFSDGSPNSEETSDDQDQETRQG